VLDKLFPFETECTDHKQIEAQLSELKQNSAPAATLSEKLAPDAATDDRCANFSASTCPTQNLKLAADSTADKLPLEKFHRLLDLVFWGKFLKSDSISCFVFLWDVYRVSLDPVACGALNLKCAAGGGKATIS